VDDGQGRHRGTPHPLASSINRWILVAVFVVLANVVLGVFFSPTDRRMAVSVGLLAVSMIGFYRASKLIKRGYPNLGDR